MTSSHTNLLPPAGLLSGEQLEYWRELAHELYAATRGLMPEGWDAGHMDHMPGIKAARAAIAKAEGRELLTDEERTHGS